MGWKLATCGALRRFVIINCLPGYPSDIHSVRIIMRVDYDARDARSPLDNVRIETRSVTMDQNHNENCYARMFDDIVDYADVRYDVTSSSISFNLSKGDAGGRCTPKGQCINTSWPTWPFCNSRKLLLIKKIP